jgi:hypothetical protein
MTFQAPATTDQLLHELDESVIKKTFMLPNIGSIDDLSEIIDELDLESSEDDENQS